jgi:hypothetical protein
LDSKSATVNCDEAYNDARRQISMTLGRLILLTTVALNAAASTISYQLTQDGCSVSCGAGPFGTVTITDVGTGTGAYVIVTETLAMGYVYANSSGKQALFYNLSISAGSVTVAHLNDPTNFAAASGSKSGSPYGSFYGAITCITCQGGNAGNAGGPLSFELHDSTTGLTTSNFVPNGSGIYFASDVRSPAGNTGDVGAISGDISATPEPGTLWLTFATAGLVLGFRRRL